MRSGKRLRRCANDLRKRRSIHGKGVSLKSQQEGPSGFLGPKRKSPVARNQTLVGDVRATGCGCDYGGWGVKERLPKPSTFILPPIPRVLVDPRNVLVSFCLVTAFRSI